MLCRSSNSEAEFFFYWSKHGRCWQTGMGPTQQHTYIYVKSKGFVSWSDCEHEDWDIFIVDSGTSLHMMSKNELTSGEKDTIRQSKEPSVITTASGEAEWTEEATVCVNDLDVCVTMMLLVDSSTMLSFGLFCECMGSPTNGKRGESPSLVKDGTVILCRSENR